MIRLAFTNTLSGRREPFYPLHAPHVRMYVCGITPYDYAHLGHGRVYVTFDVLYRLLAYLGYQVTYCRNFTDIDDKLLNRAQQEFGDSCRYLEIANRYIATFHEDMHRLQCFAPTYEPRVTEHIPEIIAFVQGLVDAGKAYVVGGDVYFSIDAFPTYGKLSHRHLDELCAGARVAVNEKKKNPLDFALWKSEQNGVSWESPWGQGRPGWHIECSALARRYLGETLDIHAGGMDLIFPHHENEIAQSEGLFAKPLAHFWIHNAFVQVNKEKMSKSLGNFFTLRDLFQQYDPLVVRFLLLQHQYRGPIDFTQTELVAARTSYQRLCRVFEGAVPPVPPALKELLPVPLRMIEALSEDLNTPAFFGILHEHLYEIQQDSQLRAQVAGLLMGILGLQMIPLPEKTVEMTPEIQALMDAREAARARKDWAAADALRKQLIALGVEVRDKKL